MSNENVALCAAVSGTQRLTIYMDCKGVRYGRMNGGDVKFYAGDLLYPSVPGSSITAGEFVRHSTIEPITDLKPTHRDFDAAVHASYGNAFLFFKESSVSLPTRTTKYDCEALFGYVPDGDFVKQLDAFTSLETAWKGMQSGLWLVEYLEKLFERRTSDAGKRGLCKLILNSIEGLAFFGRPDATLIEEARKYTNGKASWSATCSFVGCASLITRVGLQETMHNVAITLSMGALDSGYTSQLVYARMDRQLAAHVRTVYRDMPRL